MDDVKDGNESGGEDIIEGGGGSKMLCCLRVLGNECRDGLTKRHDTETLSILLYPGHSRPFKMDKMALH